MRLPDGRTLGFAEYGDPRGRQTLLYFHGYPSARVEARALHRLAAAHSLRVLALDRPGYGPLHAPAPPPAARLASRRRRLRHPPWPPPLRRARRLRRRALCRRLAVGRWRRPPHDPRPVRATRKAHDKEACRLEADPGSARPSLMVGGGGGAEDERSVAERRAALIDLLLGEPFAQGPDGAVQEARILTDDDWGFRLEDVDVPIKIWHGVKDTNAPIEAIRYLADRLPRAELHEFAEDTHYTVGDHVEEAVLDLMGEDKGEEKL